MKKFTEFVESISGEYKPLEITVGERREFKKKLRGGHTWAYKKYQILIKDPFEVLQYMNDGTVLVQYEKDGRTAGIPGQQVMELSDII
jgi:hypothetical protein